MNRVKVLKKISAGFQTDMDTLLRKFTAEESIRYNAFSKVWREMKFSLVFCGRKERELRLFFEEIVPIILQLWLPTCSFRERVFGLYMLYAVYAVQPISPKLKVRLRLADWEQSEVLLRIATREQHLDVCYILHRMRLENCFHLVAFLRQRSPVMYHGQEEDVRSIIAANAKVFSPLEKMTKNGIFQQLQLIHQQYMTMKAAQEKPEVRDLTFVKEDVYDNICRRVSVLQLVYRSQQIQAAASTSRRDRGSTVGGETVAARRENLRAQQFSTVTKTRRGKRYEELMCDVSTSRCEDESAPESVESSSPPAKRARRKFAATKKSRESSSTGASKRGASKATRGGKKSGGKKPSSKKPGNTN
ncbi:hypothetical protein MTO96_004189 [Rhipicephalus appendiculatus]